MVRQSQDLVPLPLNRQMRELLAEAKNNLGFNEEGDYTMFISDLPDSPPSLPPVIMVASANSGQQTTTARHTYWGVVNY